VFYLIGKVLTLKTVRFRKTEAISRISTRKDAGKTTIHIDSFRNKLLSKTRELSANFILILHIPSRIDFGSIIEYQEYNNISSKYV
jgi:hypothetical protein